MIKKMMMMFVVAMATGCVYAAPQVRLTEMVDGIEWEYFVKDNRATVSKCKTRLVVGHVNIPSILGGYTVTDIYSGAFVGCHNMTSVTIPENIISIGNRAFSDCIQLETIFIPKNVVEVGNGAFQLCDNLQSIVVDPQNSSFVSVNGLLCNADVTEIVACPAGLRSFVFPASVTSIRSHAFRGCHYLREITIPQKVSRIGTGAFGDCKNLQMITVEVGSLFYCVVNGILCDYQKKKTIACPGGYSSVIIPSSITDIGDYSFTGCWQLSNIKIPSTVIRIGESAFSGCSKLQKLKIEEGLISIGYGAFQSCELLSEVMLPSTLSKIGDSAFYNCSLRVYYQSLKPPICDGIYDSSDKISISYIPRSWNIMDETWQDMPFEYWDPSSDGNGGTADMNAMFRVASVVADGCETMGKVTGGKTAKAGTKVTLMAVANRGYVFAGWYTEDGKPASGSVDYRTASFPYVIGDEDVTFVAKFVPQDEDAPVIPSAASAYDSYLQNGDNVLGTVQAKVAKPKFNRKTNRTEAKVTVSIQLVGEKKITVKGEMDAATGVFTGEAKDGRKLTLTFDMDGLSGTFNGIEVVGNRNLFSSKDKAEKSDAEAILEPWLGALNMICDGGVLTVTIAKKGKVTVKGTLDGAKVSAKATALIGEDAICIPVAYSKKGVELAFTLWLPFDGGAIEVVGLGDAVISKAGTLKSGAVFGIDEYLAADIPGAQSSVTDETGVSYSLLPDGVSVSANGRKWLVEDGAKAAKVKYDKKAGKITVAPGKKGQVIVNASGLKLTYKVKDGSFKGSFYVYTLIDGKFKKQKANVTGVLINGIGYGTATIKKIGSWSVVIE